MISKLRNVLRPARPAPRAPAGWRLYAVGDLHGRLDLFEALLSEIACDHAGRPDCSAEIILLGDLIDRGPDSAGLLDRLTRSPPPWAAWTIIRGNHEQVLLDILAETDRQYRDALIEDWLSFGGAETLASYRAPAPLLDADYPSAVAEWIADELPLAHVDLLRAAPLSVRRGDYLFVHAGVRPEVPLHMQTPRDLLWIREEFLRSPRDHGATIVHGHTPTAEPELRANRIGIDTGAYATGVLTALALEGETQRVIQVRG
ncbi:MAG: metallophosphoesterase family protein [Sphingomonadaceae bacterium]|nr:metallophosphoesterase family protein [Sphingomonadaceae bacterium]